MKLIIRIHLSEFSLTLPSLHIRLIDVKRQRGQRAAEQHQQHRVSRLKLMGLHPHEHLRTVDVGYGFGAVLASAGRVVLVLLELVAA